MNMRSSLEMAIRRGDYDLAGMLERINLCFAAGTLTTGEWQDLTEMARDGARAQVDPDGEIPRIWEAINQIRANIDELIAKSGGQAQYGETEWPEWKTPTGAHDAYYRGAQITYTDGKRYTCTAPEGVACTWSPDVMPSYWAEESSND